MSSTAKATPFPDIAGASWFAWSFTISFISVALFPCACGHLPIEAIPGSTVGAVLAWVPFLRHERTRPYHRVLAVFFVGFATFAFTKNVADIFWLGHEPLFQ